MASALQKLSGSIRLMSASAAQASALARCLTLFFPINPFYSRLFPDKSINEVHDLAITVLPDDFSASLSISSFWGCTVTFYLSLCQINVIEGVKPELSNVKLRNNTSNLQAVSTQIAASPKWVRFNLMTRICRERHLICHCTNASSF